MKTQLRTYGAMDFGIAEHVLLLFNDHDTKIALKWEIYTPPPVKESDIVSTSFAGSSAGS